MATYSSTLAWEIPRTEKPSGLQTMGLQRVRFDLRTKPPESTPTTQHNTTHTHTPYSHLKLLQDRETSWSPEVTVCLDLFVIEVMPTLTIPGSPEIDPSHFFAFLTFINQNLYQTGLQDVQVTDLNGHAEDNKCLQLLEKKIIK